MMQRETQPESNVTLGLGQLHAAKGSDTVLTCLGIGSCVALSAYDPASKVGGMAHMVLPRSGEGKGQPSHPKFVDCAIPLLMKQMEELGAKKARLVVKIAGGAQMIKIDTATAIFDIGDRNVEMAKAVLAGLGVSLHGADTGGDRGRTVRLYLDSGKVVVSSVGGPSREL